MAAPASPRLRLTVSPEWEILPAAAPAGARGRALATAPDPFVSRVLADTRLTLMDVRSVRPRRGAQPRAGLLTAEIDEPSSASGWVVVARHPSGALTFHPPAVSAPGIRRFDVRLASPPSGRRGPVAAVRVFFCASSPRRRARCFRSSRASGRKSAFSPPGRRSASWRSRPATAVSSRRASAA